MREERQEWFKREEGRVGWDFGEELHRKIVDFWKCPRPLEHLGTMKVSLPLALDDF